MEEEQQIQDFVHRMLQEPVFRGEVLADPDAALERLKYSQRVVRILKEGLLVFAEKAALPPPWQGFFGIVSLKADVPSASWWV